MTLPLSYSRFSLLSTIYVVPCCALSHGGCLSQILNRATLLHLARHGLVGAKGMWSL